MGGSGTALTASVAYSNWIFGASIFVWTLNLLACALIGSGNTLVPQIFAILSLVAVPLSPALIFGWGPMPRLGIAGAGLAFACYNALATIALIGYARSSRATLRLPLDLRLIEWRLLRDILHVGSFASLSAIIPTFSLMLITAAVARFGIDAIVGFGIAMRVDFLLVPLYLGICAGILPMVGTNVGAGQIQRARQIAWAGALIGASIGGAAGLLLILAPQLWISLFNNDPNVLASGSLYFHILAIQYPLSAFGIVLGAAAQGAGRPFWPFAAIITRVIIGAGGGWLVVAGLGWPLAALFAMPAIGGVFYCGILTVGLILGRTIPDRTQTMAGAATEMKSSDAQV
jgi:Na+-driven multidrug efflux pump